MALKRLTRQRKAVLEVVKRAHNHPDAAWIYQEVRKVVPKVSLGTIYRTLEALVEEGYLIPITKAGEATRYDANLHPHLHLVCQGCGAIVDLEVDLPRPGGLPPAGGKGGGGHLQGPLPHLQGSP